MGRKKTIGKDEKLRNTETSYPVQYAVCEGGNPVSDLTAAVLERMRSVADMLEKLGAERARCKLSNSRAVSVAKELRELIKVMAAYEIKQI